MVYFYYYYFYIQKNGTPIINRFFYIKTLDSFNILQIIFQIVIIKPILGIFHEIIYLFVKKRIKLAKVNEILTNFKIERSTEPNP